MFKAMFKAMFNYRGYEFDSKNKSFELLASRRNQDLVGKSMIPMK